MKHIRNFIALALYRIVLIIVKLTPAKQREKQLLLIKTDEIGDYILFRYYFKYIRNSNKYRNHKITLVGNSSWKQLYDLFDADCLDNAIWLDKGKYKSSLMYRYSLLMQIRKLSTTDVVNCVFSRSLTIDDGIALVATGETKIALKGDEANRQIVRSNIDNTIYNNIIDAGGIWEFDTVRNRNYVELVLNEKNIPIATSINKTLNHYQIHETNYYVLFIGAGNAERKWPIPHFVELATYITLKYHMRCIVCGGPGDEQDAAEFIRLYQHKATNSTGKTTLPYFMELLSKANFLVCVDTGALHMAAAVDCAVIGLYSGKFYGRFAPYPLEISKKFFPIYPDFVDKLIEENNPVLYDTSIMKNNTMRLIPPTKLYPFVDRIMSGI